VGEGESYVEDQTCMSVLPSRLGGLISQLGWVTVALSLGSLSSRNEMVFLLFLHSLS